MNLTTLTAADLKHLVSLVEERENLRAELARIDARLAAYEGNGPGQAATAKAGQGRTIKTTKARRAARGSLKAEILGLIQAAGEAGIKVTDIAKQPGLSSGRIYTWFYSTGNNVPEIRKVGPARYAWTGPAAKVRPAPAPRPPQPTKPVKPRG